jgi:hypothetical protein
MSIVVSIPVDIHPIHHPSLPSIAVSQNPVVIILFLRKLGENPFNQFYLPLDV